ncbi:MAG: transcriptional regulator, partial [Actinobacteria bacterium]|nr:transcriptional regulator [Actinomycetota bacterium]
MASQEIVPIVLRDRNPVTMIQRTKSGRQIITTASPVLGEEGNLIGVVGTSRDVTETLQMKKQLEEAWEQVSRYRSELTEIRAEMMRDADVIAVSPKTKKVLDLATKVALVDTTVLILGESGQV